MLFAVIGDGVADGEVPDAGPAAAAPTSADFDAIRAEFHFSGSDAVVLKCFLLWAALVGAISLEVFGQYGTDTLSAPGDVFDGQVRLLVAALSR
jgi:hypothetical protein